MNAPAHAFLAPSSAHIWAGDGSPGAGCAASATMQARYPDDEESEEAREGTAAHWYVSETLNGRDVQVGAIAENGERITAEMVDCAQGLLTDIRDTWQTCFDEGGSPVMWVEQRMHMAVVHAENWGTPDVVLIDALRRKLFVWDYKYGHRFVDAAGNLQLIDYAIGALSALAIPHHEWPEWSVSLNIAQPRNYHSLGPLREWQTDGRKLLDEYRPALNAAANRATAPDPGYQTGEYCRDCSARHACPALQQVAAYAIDVAKRAEPPVDLTPHALGLELRHLDDAAARIKARKTGLEEQALGMIRRGDRVPFFKAQHATGRERWTVPAAEAFALGDIMGVDVRKPQEPVTPNQARKAFDKAGVDASVIKAYAETPRGALRLEKVDDNDAKLAFE